MVADYRPAVRYGYEFCQRLECLCVSYKSARDRSVCRTLESIAYMHFNMSVSREVLSRAPRLHGMEAVQDDRRWREERRLSSWNVAILSMLAPISTPATLSRHAPGRDDRGSREKYKVVNVCLWILWSSLDTGVGQAPRVCFANGLRSD